LNKPKPLLVTAAIIHGLGDQENSILIAQRRSDDRFAPLCWEFPGGKVEFAEDPRVCLKREIKEELNIEIEVGEVFDVSSHVYNLDDERLHVVLLFYSCRCISGQLTPLEVADVRWIKREELGSFDWAPADVVVVQRLLKNWL
jgi:8-oxo-dGTP diphosphatase